MANEIRELIKQRKKNEMLEVLFNVASEELSKKDSEIAELRESEVKLVNETEDLKCEIEDLRQGCIGIYDDFAYEEIISMSPSIFNAWKLGKKFKHK